MDFPHYGTPLTETCHIWGFWALSGERVWVNVEGGVEAYFWRFVSSSVLFTNTWKFHTIFAISWVCYHHVVYDDLMTHCNRLHSSVLWILLMLETEYSGFGGQYHACWCTGSWSRQSISRHSIGCVGQTTYIVVLELVSSTYVMPSPRYNSKCEYIYHNL